VRGADPAGWPAILRKLRPLLFGHHGASQKASRARLSPLPRRPSGPARLCNIRN